VHKIPENEPWCFLTELRAKEKIMEYITKIKKPINGNPIKAISFDPAKQIIVLAVASINIIRLSKNFMSNNRKNQRLTLPKSRRQYLPQLFGN